MPFTWSTSISQGDEVGAEDINEMQDNIDTIVSNAGSTPYAWSSDPIATVGDEIDANEFIVELRDAADYAEENSCTVADAADYTSMDSPDYTTANGTQKSSENLADQIIFNSSRLTTG